MNKQTFLDRLKVLFSEETEKVEHKEDKPCECAGEPDCKCSEKLEEEMADDAVEAPEKKECECEDGDENCDCEEKADEVLEPEMVAEEAPEEEVKEEEPLANISESMSSIDNLSDAVAKLANSPSEGEVKLSKANSKGVKKISAREERLIALSKRG